MNSRNDISLRKAKLADLPILLDFEQGIITAERPFTTSLKPDPISYYDLEDLIKSDQSHVIVAEINKELIGSAYAQIKTAPNYKKFDQYGYLGFMFVKPDYRGQGIVQRLINELENWLKSQSISEVRLDVYDDNQSAVNAYKKTGFKKHLVEMRKEI